MSWCLASIGISRSPAVSGAPEYGRLSMRSGDLSLAAGGPASTCRFGSYSDESGSPFEGWLVLGLGLDPLGAQPGILDDEEWARRLMPAEPLLDGIDGHYLIVRWSARAVELRSDRLGMRTVFIAHDADGVIFSTRLDWLARARGGGEIDFASFGAHWLGFNKLVSTSPLRGIVRLGPGGVARCSRGGVEVEQTPWSPREATGRDNPIEILDALLGLAGNASAGMTLGLSGGLDSRLLLAILLGRKSRFGVHLFGKSTEPDVALGSRIARDHHLDLLQLDEPVPSVDESMMLLREYVGATGVIEPASAVTKLRYYPRLAATGRLMIDGGMGEIARRQFGNRLLRGGRSALMRRDPKGMLPHMMLRRADIFTPEIESIMRRGMHDELEAFLETMPDAGEIGAENFVDLLAVRTRFPFVAGVEQARVDGELPNFMPYAQPSFIESALRLPVTERRNGVLFRKIIEAEAPALAGYPLVKSQIYYPYRLTTLPAWLWTRARKLLGGAYHDDGISTFLATMRGPIEEMARSERVRTYAPYDRNKIAAIIEGYYAGDMSLQKPLDWWLAFEVWRGAVGA